MTGCFLNIGNILHQPNPLLNIQVLLFSFKEAAQGSFANEGPVQGGHVWKYQNMKIYLK